MIGLLFLMVSFVFLLGLFAAILTSPVLVENREESKTTADRRS